MKNLFLTVFGLLSMGAFAQATNIFPTTGNAGIGTTTPSYPLEILYKSYSSPAGTYDHTRVGSYITTPSFPPLVVRNSGLYISETPTELILRTKTLDRDASTQSFLSFLDSETTTSSSVVLTMGYGSTGYLKMLRDGKVKISSTNIATPNGYRLFVEDGILTEKVKVAVEGTSNWADYVFADDYQLMPLNEVEAFTKENKHLPNVPSAQEMVTEGLDVAQMDAKLLEKVEELTLYLIEQNKKLEAQSEQIETLQKEIKELKGQH